MTMPATADAEIAVQLAGVFGVRRHGVAVVGPALGSRKARLLLKVLAVRRPHAVPLPPLVELLWGDDPPHHGAESVATLVSRLAGNWGPA